MPKIHGPQRLSQDPVPSSLSGPNMSGVLELHPPSGEESEPDVEDQQIPGISPLQVGGYVSRMDPSFKCLGQRVQGVSSSHIAFIAFVEYITAKNCTSECEC